MKLPKKASAPESGLPEFHANKLWRPPNSERCIVTIMGGLLAGALGFGIVYGVLVRKVWGELWDAERTISAVALESGALVAVYCLLGVAACIYVFSAIRIDEGIISRLVLACTGAAAAAVLGFVVGCDMGGQGVALGQSGVEDRDFTIQRRSMFAGVCTAAGCGTITGISLFKLYDRSSESPPSDPKPPRKPS